MDSGFTIRMESIYIRLGQSGGLDAAPKSLQQGNIRIGVLQETKLTKGVHMCYIVVYRVWGTDVEMCYRVWIIIIR